MHPHDGKTADDAGSSHGSHGELVAYQAFQEDIGRRDTWARDHTCGLGIDRRGPGYGRGGRCYVPCREFFGEFLYLRPRSAEVNYATAINGAIVPPAGAPPVQIGPAGIVDPDYQPGFRVGFNRVLGDCAGLGATYTHFESNTSDQVSIDAPNVIRSQVFHPGTAAADADFLLASAGYGVDFDLVDLDYRSRFWCSGGHAMSYLIGARYARLKQDFSSLSSNSTTIEEVTTDSGFDGGGIRAGVEWQRHACRSGWMVYARGTASFVAGEFRAHYSQTDNISGTVVNTAWKAGRIVPILDLGLGVGWTAPGGCWNFRAGYMFSAWYNTVKTAEFIQAVQSNSFVGLGDTLTFDGLMARAEVRF